MRSEELPLKVIDISFKNSLLIAFLAKVNSTCLHLRICEYLRHGPLQRGPMWNKPQGHGLSWPCAFLYAFVNTSVMVDHPIMALCGTSRRVMDYPDPAHSSMENTCSLPASGHPILRFLKENPMKSL